jgi:glycerol-3-phosphate acyltransferase PlsY
VAYLAGSCAAALARRETSPPPWKPWVYRAAEFLIGGLTVYLCSEPGPWGQSLIGTAVVAGRLWPLWGGDAKGQGLFVAGGALSAMTPLSVPLWAILWAIGFVSSGYRTWGTITGVVLLPVGVGFLAGWSFGLMIVPVCLLILDRYRGGVARLIDGAEPKHHWRTGA